MSANLPHRPPNHVFVDVENVKMIDTTLLDEKNVMFHLFLGPDNKTLKIELVEPLLRHADRVQLIRSPEAGKNSLDFVLAYHLGQTAAIEPKAHFHIVSKDKGFDSLVKLLKSRKISIRRHAEWNSLTFQAESIPAVHAVIPQATPVKKPVSGDSEKVLGHLRKSVNNRPKKQNTLISQVENYLGKGATVAMAQKIVEELRCAGYLSFDDKLKADYTKLGKG